MFICVGKINLFLVNVPSWRELINIFFIGSCNWLVHISMSFWHFLKTKLWTSDLFVHITFRFQQIPYWDLMHSLFNTVISIVRKLEQQAYQETNKHGLVSSVFLCKHRYPCHLGFPEVSRTLISGKYTNDLWDIYAQGQLWAAGSQDTLWYIQLSLARQ